MKSIKAQKNPVQCTLRYRRPQTPTRTTEPSKTFKAEGQWKTFHDINKLKELMSLKPPQQRILEAILQAEEKKEISQESIEEKNGAIIIKI